MEKEVEQVFRVVPEFLSMPFNRIWSSYDREADVLYKIPGKKSPEFIREEELP